MADAGFKLSVEGEREFKKAISEINAQIKANAAELKLLTAQYANTDDSMEKLRDRQNVLEEGLESQGKKVSTLRDQYEKMAETYGENDSRVLKLKTDLANAATEYANMSKEVKENQEAIDASWKAMENYQEVTARVGDTLGGLDDIMAQNRKAIEKLSEDYKSLGESSRTAALREEALVEQNKLLADSIDSQKKKIDALNEELDAAVRLYGDGSDEVRGYKDAIIDATGELEQMEQQIKDNNEAMSKSDDAVSPLGGVLDEILDKLGIQMPEELEKLSGEGGGFSKAAVAAGLITAAIVGAIGKLAELTKEAAAWADEMEKKSQITGIDSEQLQVLEYAGKKLGVEMEVIEDVIKEIGIKSGETDAAIRSLKENTEEWNSMTIKEKGDALAEEIKMWRELGVTIYDTSGEIKPAEDLFYELLDALGDVKNESERLSRMNELLGESSKDLIPFINAGSDAVKAFGNEARSAGVIIDKETIGELDDLQKELDEAALKWDAFLKRAGATGGVLLEVIRGESGFDALKESMQEALVPLDALTEGLLGLTTGEIAEKMTRTQLNIKNIKYIPEMILDFIKNAGGNILFPAYANGTYNHVGGYALVGEKGPEIVELPRGSRVYPNGTGPQMSESNVYNITIPARDIREFNDIIRIANGQKQSIRMGYAQKG